MQDMDKDTTLTFRLPSATRAALERAAVAEHRTLGSMVVLILDEWLRAKGQSAPSKPKRGKRRA